MIILVKEIPLYCILGRLLMRNFILTTLLSISICFAFMGIECNSDGVPTKFPKLGQDVISFMIDGQDVNFVKGFTDYGNVPFYNTCSGTIMIIGTAGNDISINDEPENFVILAVNGVTSGTYYDANTLFGYMTTMDIYDNEYETTFTVQINNVNPVGEYTSGTFSGQVKDEKDNNFTITDGYFNVVRLPECTFDLFGGGDEVAKK